MAIDNQVALITGSSTGIGHATADALAREGCRVVLSARSEERLHEVATGIEGGGGDATVLPFDLQDESSITELIDTVTDEFG